MRVISIVCRGGLLGAFGCLAGLTAATAQPNRPAPNAGAIWRDSPAARTAAATSTWGPQLTAYRAVEADASGLAAALSAAPLENTGVLGTKLELPTPDGGTATFRIVEAPVMEPALAAQFPQIKTYAGVGLDDPTARLRCDLTPRGFHAQVRTGRGEGEFTIDPVDAAQPARGLVSYWKTSLRANPAGPPPVCREVEITGGSNPGGTLPGTGPTAQRVQSSLGGTLRTYRLAVAATGEFTASQGGTVSSALASIVTTVNRITGVFELELAARLVLIANETAIIYTNGATDPYTAGDKSAMLQQNRTNLTSVIGDANFDLGHVFDNANLGGVAYVGVVCNNSYKGGGVSGLTPPAGDAFETVVIHETGHQFSARHTFSGVTGGCSPTNPTSGWEPGSGSTFMSYAGSCGSDNVGAYADRDYFHGGNISEMIAHASGSALCATTAATGNTPPTVTGPVNKSIPVNTPFKLTAGATDAEGDALTYNWEQMDIGSGTLVTQSTVQTTNSTIPLFRSWPAVTDPTRYFPRLLNLRNNTTVTGEVLPTVGRTLSFRCTVRDQHFSSALGRIVGGINQTNTVVLTTVATSGPFVVTSPTASGVTWTAGSSATVTWNVAGTSAAPISCAAVNVLLSTDGGATFPITLASNVANSGTATVTVPANATTQGRVMVAAADNYFFDISNANFTITASAGPVATITSFTPASGPVGTSVTINGTNFTGATSVKFNGTAASTYTVVSAAQITATVPAGATTGAISVTTPNGTATSASAFTVQQGPPPTVTSFTPASGVVGATITVSGTNFTGATSVAFNGVAAPNFTVNSATSIAVAVPGAASTGKISVTTPAGTALSAAIFKVLPTITSFTPTSGAPGTVVTLTGTGLTGATAVKFAMVSAAFTVVNSTTITFTIPAAAVTGKVTVTTPGGSVTSAGVFTVAPTITSFTPGQGAPGSVVLLEGLNFTSTTTVSFNGVNAVRAVNSGTLITATVPAAATTGPITIANATGSASTTTFTVVPGPAPTVTSFTPTTNVIVGTVITITGTNLTGATAVRFNATTTSAVTVLSATQVQAAVPAGATSGFVYVVTPKGMAKSAASLTIIAPPSITSFSPASGSPGAVVLIAGYNLTNATGVTFNGVAAASYTVNSATQIAAYVPAGATTGKLGVTTIAGSALSAASFTVTSAPAPTISALSPGSGPRGSSVVVTGTNFSGVTSVKLGASTVAAGAYTVNSATQITLTVPATAVTGTVYVTTAGGMAQSASAFTVILAPTISSFTPASGAVGTLVTVNGSNFTGATSVTFGSTATASFTLVSAARITVNVPAGATTGTIKVTNAAGTATSAGTFTVTSPKAATVTSAPSQPLEVVMYPNPASTFVGVQVTHLPANATSVELLDGVGRVVRTAALTEGYNRVSLADLTPGMYVVRVANQLQRLVVE